MTRGFITIATGRRHYYEIAANLVKSYRYFSSSPLPFAIIAEEENEYTALFDDVIITNEATRSFCDKFLLLKLCPYDETIFLDADCLAYGDLNLWWKEFEGATDFSAPGANIYPPYSDDDGSWYGIEDLGQYGESLPYKCRMHAGVIFVRHGNAIDKMYTDCMELYHNYSKMTFHKSPHNVDENVFPFAMAMNQMLTITEKVELLGFYPCLEMLNTDMINGKLSLITQWGTNTTCGKLLHWGTIQTYQPLYRYNVKCLEYMIAGKKTMSGNLLYEKRIWLFFATAVYKIQFMWKRIINKMEQTLGKE